MYKDFDCYKNQSANAVNGYTCCLFWDPYKTLKCTVWAEHRVFEHVHIEITKFVMTTSVRSKLRAEVVM